MRELIRIFEKIFLLTLAAIVIMRMAPAVPRHPQLMLFLASELVGLLFILTQRKGDWTASPRAAAIAFLGTAAPLCAVPSGQLLVPELVTTVFTLLGAGIALLGKLSLRRSFGLIAANRGVKTGGMYAFVRHPIYCGYIINHIGVLLLYASPWNALVFATAWLAFWLRAGEEERFLLADPAYGDYAARVRYRLLPGII